MFKLKQIGKAHGDETADPYSSGLIESVKHCPYCGRELKGEKQ